MNIGIDAISFYVPHYYLDLTTLASAREKDATTFYTSLGQEKMAVLPPDEDIVTMGANAAADVLHAIDTEKIHTVLFATESSIDQSKAAGIYVHHLLNLNPKCRIIELKQACYSGTGGLQLAASLVSRYPDQKVLLIASDTARYGLNHPAEPSQGCGAIAMVISSNPRILSLDLEQGLHTEDVMDFWRPNYSREAFVEGKYSSFVYLHALEEVWKHYQLQSNRNFSDIDFYCYHTPVSRLVEKAHKLLAKLNGYPNLTIEEIKQHLDASLKYSRIIGNTYAASLYINLISLLDHQNNLDGKRIGFYSYGSGYVAEFFSGVIQPEYHHQLNTQVNHTKLDHREALSYENYEQFYLFHLPGDGNDYHIPQEYKTGSFRLAGIQNHQRIYEKKI